MDGVLWNGLMKVFTKVNGSTVFNKALELWCQLVIKLLTIFLVQLVVKKVYKITTKNKIKRLELVSLTTTFFKNH